MTTETYYGTPCRKAGHTLRFVSTDRCVECRREDYRTYCAANPEMARARRKYRNANRERQRKRNAPLAVAARPEPEACECCARPRGMSALHFDHCHETGAFRGWLCGQCNQGIGMLGDDITGLRRAMAYLGRGM